MPYFKNPFGSNSVSTIKTTTFHGIRQDVDEGDLPVGPECWCSKGKNFWIENGNLMCRNDYGLVTATDITTSINDGYTYKIKSMGMYPENPIHPYSPIIAGCEVYSGAEFSHNALVYGNESGDDYEWSVMHWLGFGEETPNVEAKLQSAEFDFLIYDALYGKIIMTNGADPVLVAHSEVPGNIGPLQSDGWLSVTADAATDVFTLAGTTTLSNGSIVEIYSLENNYPALMGIDLCMNFRAYYIRDVSGNTFKLAVHSPSDPAVDITSAGTSLCVRLVSNWNTEAPRGKTLMLHAERVWMGGPFYQPPNGASEAVVTTAWYDDNAVYFSDSYHDGETHPTDWTTKDITGNIVVNTWDGDNIVKLFNFEGDPLILKKNTVFRITGESPDTYNVVQLFTAKGTIAPRSVCYYRGNLFYATYEGVLVFNGVSTDAYLTNEIRNIWYPDPNLMCVIVGDALYVIGRMYDAVTGVLGQGILAVDLVTKNICPWEMLANNVSARNLISNGSFEDMTGWTASDASAYVLNNELICTATGQTGEVHQDVALVAGHMYYIGAWLKTNSSNVKLALHDGSGYYACDSIGTGSYHHCSRLVSVSGTDGAFHVLLDCRESGWTECRAKYAVLLDLTEIFGAGHEPTLETMNAILDEYDCINRFIEGYVGLWAFNNPGIIVADATINPVLTMLRTGVTRPEFWFAGNDIIYKYDPVLDLGYNYPPTMTYHMPITDFGSSSKRKRLSRITVTGEGGTMTVTPYKDGEVWTAKTLELSEMPGKPVSAKLSASGYRMQLVLANAGGCSIVVRDIEQEYGPQGV